MRGLRIFVTGLIVGLAVAAIDKEMGKPPAQRTWRGAIAGIPYDFRVWEWRNIAREYWNPTSDQILVDHAIGIGWGVNFAAVSRRAQEWLQAPAPTTAIK